MIPLDIVEEVRNSADIVGIVRAAGIALDTKDGMYRGVCPFHGGTSQSFVVMQRDASYHCLVCHAKGDVFDFVQGRRLLRDAAVRFVAEWAGIVVP